MIFINTRPKTRAERLTAFLQSHGVSVFELPLLELVACELSKQETRYLTQINDYHALMFISESAVSYFFDFIRTHNIQLNPNLTVITVGRKTADIFNNFWQKTTHILPNLITPCQFNLPENNEGLLQLPIIQSLQKGNKTLILKGKDGRDLVQTALTLKGVTVHDVAFYQRIFSSNSPLLFQQFFLNYSYGEKMVVLITSLTAWEHWQQDILTLPELNLASFHYIVLQQRIAETVKNFSQNFSVISDLAPTTIATSLKKLA